MLKGRDQITMYHITSKAGYLNSLWDFK